MKYLKNRSDLLVWSLLINLILVFGMPGYYSWAKQHRLKPLIFKRYTDRQMKQRSLYLLKINRASFFAKKGHDFNEQFFNNYFSQYSWYKAVANVQLRNFSRANRNYLRRLNRRIGILKKRRLNELKKRLTSSLNGPFKEYGTKLIDMDQDGYDEVVCVLGLMFELSEEEQQQIRQDATHFYYSQPNSWHLFVISDTLNLEKKIGNPPLLKMQQITQFNVEYYLKSGKPQVSIDVYSQWLDVRKNGYQLNTFLYEIADFSIILLFSHLLYQLKMKQPDQELIIQHELHFSRLDAKQKKSDIIVDTKHIQRFFSRQKNLKQNFTEVFQEHEAIVFYFNEQIRRFEPRTRLSSEN